MNIANIEQLRHKRSNYLQCIYRIVIAAFFYFSKFIFLCYIFDGFYLSALSHNFFKKRNAENYLAQILLISSSNSLIFSVKTFSVFSIFFIFNLIAAVNFQTFLIN